MKWTAVLASLLILTVAARAAGPDDQYLDIYNGILQGDNLQQSGRLPEATAKYLEAQTALKDLQRANPVWNTEVVSFRLEYLAEQLQALQKALPPKTTPPPKAAPVAKPITEAESLREQVRWLAAANAELESKLKEALSVQPAAISPHELAKAEQRNIALQKERDLLNVALEQAKAATPPSASSAETNKTAKKPAAPFRETDKTSRQLVDARQALADLKSRSSQEAKEAQAELERLKASLADAQKKVSADAAEGERVKESLADALKKIAADDAEMKALKSSQASVGSKDIGAERDKLKAELAARTKDLADSEAHRDQSVIQLRAQLAALERQRDEMKTKLAAAPAPAPATTDAQADTLRARLAVLEAKAAPYTPEELAVLHKSPALSPAEMPAAPAERKHIVHSMRDLPPGAGGLMEEAKRATMERNYAGAAEKYREILRQDENNVYVLAFLANAQFALGQLAECEKTVTRALALDPEDPASLYLMGILRYQQNKLDEAFNALSLSAKFNSTNASTQNYLGVVLADKGMRSAAETALRKALEADPKYADAHYNLAFVYSTETPPALELARWHYRRSVDLGHDKSQEMEKRLAPSP